MGRIINVIGEPIDERGPISHEHMLPIHNTPPALQDMGDADDILITGIKVCPILPCLSELSFYCVLLLQAR